MKKLKKVAFWATGILLILMIALFVGFYVYTLDYYRADNSVEPLIESAVKESGLATEEIDNFTIVTPSPSNDLKKGIVFYPGGKVEAKAYLPLLLQLSQKGYTAILVKMPFNLAVFNVSGAIKAKELVPHVTDWYISGHSLGGAMASSLMEKHESEFRGLILLGAYPINNAKIPTLALYGTYDILLDLEQVKKSQKIVEIVDGNHAQFGNYGVQEGDGTAKITREAQQQQATDQIHAFIEGN